MFDPDKPYCRRDGKPAKIVYTFKNGDYLVVYDWQDSKEMFYRVNSSGYCLECYPEDDLMNVPERIEGYMNIYKIDGNYVGGSLNKQKDVSDLSTAVACIKVSFTEGEGLS